jgi:hypothetical protein
VAERAAYLQQLQAGLFGRMAEIAETITAEVGMPITLSNMIQVGLPATVMGTFAQIASEFQFEEQIGKSATRWSSASRSASSAASRRGTTRSIRSSRRSRPRSPPAAPSS